MSENIKKLNNIENSVENNKVSNSKKNENDKNELKKIFNFCLDFLRSNETLVGDRAFKSLSYLINLRLLEPLLGKEIDIDGFDYKFHLKYEDDLVEIHKNKILKSTRFSNLINEEDDNLPKLMKCLWNEVLSVNEKTKNIFLPGKSFEINSGKSYKKLIEKLMEFDITKVEVDVLGEAYEEFIKDIMTGKVLGQFFSPNDVKKIGVELTDPKLLEDGTIETIFDPSMGSGGFLISSLRHIKQQSIANKIDIDWKFICNEGIGGREIEPDAYQLVTSNLLISSGHVFNTLEKGDSLRKPITKKYDIVLANPPFGIDGIIYSDIQHELRDEYIPIKSNSAVPLFLQAIIYMLKVNGRCAVVLPDGQDLFSKTNIALVSVRKYLMKTCDLQKIIYIPSGSFNNTSIKTCVLYFVKKVECSDVLTLKIKKSKTKPTKKEKQNEAIIVEKETRREYNFSNEHQTNTIKFYDYISSTEEKKLLVEVPIEQIAKNSYSLNYAEYINDESNNQESLLEDNNLVIKTLDEVCEFQNGYAFKSIDCNEKNEINIGIVSIKCIQNGKIEEQKISEFYEYNKLFEKYEIKKGDILIALSGATTGKLGIYDLEYKTYLNQRVAKIICKNSTTNKYLYYWYVCSNIEKYVLNLSKGTAQPNISTKTLEKLKIPIPPLERQQKIVEYLDFIYEETIKTSNEKILQLKKQNECCLNNQKSFGENEIKTLGEVCEINQGNLLTKNDMINGIFDVVGGGKIIGKHNEKNREGNEITLTRVGDININFIDKPYYLTDNAFSLKSIDKNIFSKYIYYLILFNKDFLNTLYKGTAQKVISKTNLKLVKIPIPSLEKQQEIVDYCESNDSLINNLEKEIEQNKKAAELFIKNVLKSKMIDDDDNNINNEHFDEESITEYSEENSVEEIVSSMEKLDIQEEVLEMKIPRKRYLKKNL